MCKSSVTVFIYLIEARIKVKIRYVLILSGVLEQTWLEERINMLI
jgi:hypothetical protein